MLRKILFLCVLCQTIASSAEIVTLNLENYASMSVVGWDGEIYSVSDNIETTTQGWHYLGPGLTGAELENQIELGSGVYANNDQFTDGYSYNGNWRLSGITGIVGTPDGISSNVWIHPLANSSASTTGNGAKPILSWNGTVPIRGVENSETYLVAYDGVAGGMAGMYNYPDGLPCPQITFGETVTVCGFDLNTTPWVYYGAIAGDGFAAPMNDGNGTTHSLTLKVTGYSLNEISGEYEATGRKTTTLFDGNGDAEGNSQTYSFSDDSGTLHSADGYIVNDWSWVDLTTADEGNFDDIDYLEFSISGTDSSMWGLNTAAYFAMDNLTYLLGNVPPMGPSVPEPSAWMLFLIGAVALWRKTVKVY